MKAKKKHLGRLAAFKAVARGLLSEEVFHAIERAAELFVDGKVKHASIISGYEGIGVMGCMNRPKPEDVGHAIRENSWSTDFKKCPKKTCTICQDLNDPK